MSCIIQSLKLSDQSLDWSVTFQVSEFGNTQLYAGEVRESVDGKLRYIVYLCDWKLVWYSRHHKNDESINHATAITGIMSIEKFMELPRISLWNNLSTHIIAQQRDKILRLFPKL